MILFTLIIVCCLFGGISALANAQIKGDIKLIDGILAFIFILGAGILVLVGFNYLVDPHDEMPAKFSNSKVEVIDPNKGAIDYSGEYIIEETKDYYIYNSPNGTYKVLK